MVVRRGRSVPLRRVAKTVNDKRREAALAGHNRDESSARQLLDDASPQVRATALGALIRMGAVTKADALRAIADPDPSVRRRGCAAAITLADDVDLAAVLGDADPRVVEAAAWALGERAEASAPAVPALATVATGHDDPLCREAAVAALGSIGDPAGIEAILVATKDKPAVRRRAVIALAPFSGPRVEEALRTALEDRDWQVRQAAEDLLADESG